MTRDSIDAATWEILCSSLLKYVSLPKIAKNHYSPKICSLNFKVVQDH